MSRPHKTEKIITMKATKEDMQFLRKLMREYGVGVSQIIRMGLRALAKAA